MGWIKPCRKYFISLLLRGNEGECGGGGADTTEYIRFIRLQAKHTHTHKNTVFINLFNWLFAVIAHLYVPFISYRILIQRSKQMDIVESSLMYCVCVARCSKKKRAQHKRMAFAASSLKLVTCELYISNCL